MHMRKVEQICRHDNSPRVRRFLKRLTNRLLRRAAKRDPENAPVKRQVWGYTL